MAKRRRSSSSSSRRRRKRNIRNETSFFKASDAQTLEQYIIASAMTGAFTAIGAVIGTVLAKYMLKEAEKALPVLPESLYSAINSQ